MKRFIAIFMTLSLMLGVSTVSAWADEVNEWEDETNMPIAPVIFATCTVGDSIYVLGGTDSKSVAIYNAKSKAWEMGKPMLVATRSTKAVAIGNKIYAVGANGTNYRTDFHSYIQIYDLSKNEWTVKNDVPVFHEVLDVVAIGEKIYVINYDHIIAKNTISIYDTITGQWTNSKVTTSSNKDTGVAACARGTSIYLIGGRINGGGITNEIEVYDTTTDTCKKIKSMPTARTYATAVMLGTKMYVIGGGTSAKATNIVEIYDTETDNWTSGVPLKVSRYTLGSAVADGKIYAIGGQDYTAKHLNTVESLQVGGSTDSATKLSVLLNAGENVQLSTSFNLDNNKNFTWNSTNEAVATVDLNGKVTAVAEGTADIYAQNAEGTFKEYIPVKVVKGVADELRLAVHLKTGEKAKLYLTDDASKVTWSSMDNSIATVAADGQVTGVKKGLAIVKAELDGQSYQIYVRVNG